MAGPTESRGATDTADAPLEDLSSEPTSQQVRALPGSRRHLNVPRRWWTWVALGVWFVALVVTSAFKGLPSTREMVFLWIVLGLFAITAGNPRAWARVILDWLPLFLILLAYDLLRGHVHDLNARAHLQPQIDFDRWLFGGTVPTVWLQRHFWHPDSPRPWDYVVWGVYMTHFFAALTTAAVLWKVAHARFRRFAALFVTLTFAGYLTYLLYPAVPPWLASQQHAIGHAQRVIQQMWRHVGFDAAARVFGKNSDYANPIAALPSLHAAYPFLLALFFWKRAGRWRILLALYPIAMALTLVYSGDHYVFDILTGWIYATVVYVVLNRFLDRRAARKAAGQAAQPDAELATT